MWRGRILRPRHGSFRVQITPAECVRQLLCSRGLEHITSQVGQHHRQLIPTQLQDHLTASAARRDRPLGLPNHGQRRKIAWLITSCNRTEERSPLGAVTQTIRRILHITTAEDAPILALQRRPHLELRVRGISQFARGAGFVDQLRVVHRHALMDGWYGGSSARQQVCLRRSGKPPAPGGSPARPPAACVHAPSPAAGRQ